MKIQYTEPKINVEELLKLDILLDSQPATTPEEKIGSDITPDGPTLINI